MQKKPPPFVHEYHHRRFVYVGRELCSKLSCSQSACIELKWQNVFTKWFALKILLVNGICRSPALRKNVGARVPRLCDVRLNKVMVSVKFMPTLAHKTRCGDVISGKDKDRRFVLVCGIDIRLDHDQTWSSCVLWFTSCSDFCRSDNSKCYVGASLWTLLVIFLITVHVISISSAFSR